MIFRKLFHIHFQLKFNIVQELHKSILTLIPQISLDLMTLLQHPNPMARIESSARLSGTPMQFRQIFVMTVTQMTILTCNDLVGQLHNVSQIRILLELLELIPSATLTDIRKIL